MYAEASVAAAQPMVTLGQKVRAFIIVAQAKSQQGLTFSEFGELFLALMRLSIEAADTLQAPGADKKAMVLEALAELFDSLADRAVPLYAYPFWIIAKPAVRAALLAAASGGFEIVLSLVRKAQ